MQYCCKRASVPSQGCEIACSVMQDGFLQIWIVTGVLLFRFLNDFASLNLQAEGVTSLKAYILAGGSHYREFSFPLYPKASNGWRKGRDASFSRTSLMRLSRGEIIQGQALMWV